MASFSASFIDSRTQLLGDRQVLIIKGLTKTPEKPFKNKIETIALGACGLWQKKQLMIKARAKKEPRSPGTGP
jgi:hypothetical protein